MKDHYIYRWGFVWRVARPDFRTHHKFANPVVDLSKYTNFSTRIYSGQIIDVDEDIDKAFKFLTMLTVPRPYFALRKRT